jgi:hypothetical protein
VLSSRHVGLQGGCVGVGCLVSDTPGAPHAPHGVACSWTAAMQGPCIRSEPPAGRSRVDSAACSCHTFRGRIMYDRITVVDSVRGPQARGGGAGRAFAIRARTYFRLTRPPVRVGNRLAGPLRANGCGAGDPRPRRASARACCSSCTLHLHLHPPVANFATVLGSGRADRGAAAGGKHPRCKPSDEAEDKREAVRRDMVNEASIGFWI